MHIYNVTFMVEQREKVGFVKWMRSEGLPLLCSEVALPSGRVVMPGCNPRLTLLEEVPGDPEFTHQACSYALQLEFDSIEAAREWGENQLQQAIRALSLKYGKEKALTFGTILRKISLNSTFARES